MLKIALKRAFGTRGRACEAKFWLANRFCFVFKPENSLLRNSGKPGQLCF
ncbi:MAG: hypothetical protein JWR68_553 [Polaromonas sp.]|nr:hypothetical protein [Polaromonas sp.]